MKVLEIKNPKNLKCADQVLINAGFKMSKNWFDDGIIEKDGAVFKISFPVWRGSFVRIERI